MVAPRTLKYDRLSTGFKHSVLSFRVYDKGDSHYGTSYNSLRKKINSEILHVRILYLPIV